MKLSDEDSVLGTGADKDGEVGGAANTHKNEDRDADDVWKKLRGHVLAGNRLPTVWVPDQQRRNDRELIRAGLDLGEKQTQIKSQNSDAAQTARFGKAVRFRLGLDGRISTLA